MTGHPRELVKPTLRLLWLCARALLKNKREPVQLPLIPEGPSR